MPTTSVALAKLNRFPYFSPASARALPSVSGDPTSSKLTESSFSNVASAAGTTAFGPRSPPMQSSAIVTLRVIEAAVMGRVLGVQLEQ